MKKLINWIMVGLFIIIGVIGANSVEADAKVNLIDMDFDLNGSIDVVDLAKVAFNYQFTDAGDNWGFKYDLNEDNIIDIYDVVIISKCIGESTAIEDSTDITSKFIDEKFKALIYATINKSSPELIFYSDVKGIKAISTYSQEISNLSGIEYFKSLTGLFCSNNKLTDLDLSGNPEITTLDCTNNSITSLNLRNNTKLKFLLCSKNKLTSLNINNISLYELNCDDNQLTTLDVSKNCDLISLSCKNNGLTTLDITKNEHLGMFNCTGNQITTLRSTKDTWLDSCYKEQYTDASHEITTNNLDIIVIGRGGATINPTGKSVVSYAMKFLGIPYVYGALGPDSFDSSGLTSYVYKMAAGIDIGRTTYDQIKSGRAVSQSELQPGDLVFTSPSHVGIYVGGGNMVHAPRVGDVVKINKVYSFYAGRRIIV